MHCYRKSVTVAYVDQLTNEEVLAAERIFFVYFVHLSLANFRRVLCHACQEKMVLGVMPG